MMTTMDDKRREDGEVVMENVNRYKPVNAASDTTRKFLAGILTREIDFYYFCRQRLNKQFAALV